MVFLVTDVHQACLSVTPFLFNAFVLACCQSVTADKQGGKKAKKCVCVCVEVGMGGGGILTHSFHNGESYCSI